MAPELPGPAADAAARPDADALMERVRAGVADKLGRGVYTQADLDQVRRVELEIRERDGFGADPTDDIARLHATWDPLAPHAFTSHRGSVGRVIVAAKQALRRGLKPVVSVVLARQAEFNGAVARLLSSSALGVEALQLRNDELERRHQELHQRCGELLAEIRRLQARLEAVDRAGLPAAAVPSPGREPEAPAAAATASYLSFEEKHRGPGEMVKERQRLYLRHFVGAPGRVLDAGCGRGEFLEILREAGIPAYGIDLDAEMVARAREKGLEVAPGDLLGHLDALPDGSLGGIFAAQVIEHLGTEGLVALVRLAHAKLAPGGRFLAETINPTSLATFSGAFYLDLTHTRPVHPEALRFLLEETGFREVDLEFSAPIPPEMKLQPLEVPAWYHAVDKDFLRVVNDNFGRLNGLVYGCQDYAAVARR